MTRAARIEALIRERLGALEVRVDDESARHAGHAQAGGGGHFAVRIVSPAFAGLGRIERHRLVHQALGEMMPREIHALSITALTPEATPGSAGAGPA